MRSRWIGVVVVALVAIVIAAIARAAEPDPTFVFDQAARVERIDLEVRQVQAEQQRLVDERRGLIRERACVAKASSREAMRRCATARP